MGCSSLSLHWSNLEKPAGTVLECTRCHVSHATCLQLSVLSHGGLIPLISHGFPRFPCANLPGFRNGRDQFHLVVVVVQQQPFELGHDGAEQRGDKQVAHVKGVDGGGGGRRRRRRRRRGRRRSDECGGKSCGGWGNCRGTGWDRWLWWFL